MLMIQSSAFAVNTVRRNISSQAATFKGSLESQVTLIVAAGDTTELTAVPADPTKDQLLYIASDVPVTVTLKGGTDMVLRPTKLLVLPLVPEAISLSVQADSEKSATVFCARSFTPVS